MIPVQNLLGVIVLAAVIIGVWVWLEGRNKRP